MKVVIIGAGSGFGSRLSIDILSREPIRHATIGLCDINEQKLETVRAFVQSAIDHHKLPAKVVASTERRELLADADFVILSVAIGGPAYYGHPYETEMRIPRKYGVHQTVGDTVGPGGIFRALRTGPVMMAVCRDINELAPRSLVLNYTNPMAIITWCLNAAANVPAVGLCHGVQGTAAKLAAYIGVPREEIGYWVAGINHLAWYLEFTHKGEDAYPKLRKALENPETYDKDRVRFEIFRNFGYFCTESTRHCAEYVPYFRKETDFLDKLAGTLQGREGKRAAWFEDMGVKASKAESIELIRSHEYASGIMEAVVTSVPFRFNGNVMNDDLVSNLPRGCCVEVPCLADGQGVHPCRVGALPEQCAALCGSNVNAQTLTVKAILERNREAAFHALLVDPITAAGLSMKEARAMFEEMWEAEGALLEYYSI